MRSHVLTLTFLVAVFSTPLSAQLGSSSGCYNDTEPPVAICDEHTVVSLTSDGKATLYATSVDDGSYDNCEIKKMEVARMVPGWCPYGVIDDTQFRPYVQFCCEDIGGPIMIRFRVTDKAGNYNECMVEVTVQDKLPPSIHCPYNKTIACDYWYPESELYNPNSPIFGSATAYDNCGLEGIHVDVVGGTTCGQGSIKRIFTAVDWGGATAKCTQHIYITDNDPFNKYDITWPKDYQASGCDYVDTDPGSLPPGFDRPTWYNEDCALIAAAYDDLTFKFVDGVCTKILRTWTVIDWCQFDPYNHYSNGIWTHVQVIKLADNNKPVFENCKDTIIYGVENTCAGRAVIDPQVWDICTPKDQLEYEYKVDIGHNGTIDIIRKDKPILDEVLPVGEHRVLWFVDDGCGNMSTCTYKLKIEDGKAPTPICYAQLSTVVMPVGGMVTLWAKDFNASSFDNCTPPNLLKYSFSSNVQEGSRMFNCDDVGTNNVQIWVTDKKGNQAYCNTWITIGDNQGICPAMNSLVGNVSTFSGTAVAGASVELYKVMPDESMEMDRTDQSEMDGSYVTGFGTTNFNRMMGVDKPLNSLEGISGIDLMLLQQHVVGINRITDPVMLFAADVDNSGHVGVNDLLMLRDAFLSQGRTLNGAELGWTFYPATCDWDDAMEPMCELMVEIDKDNPPAQAIDFLGVKKGDINGDIRTELIARSNDVLIELVSKKTVHGTSVEFVAGQDIEMSALQMSLHSAVFGEGYAFEDIVRAGRLDLNASGLINDGNLNMFWLGRNEQFVAKGTALFELRMDNTTEDEVRNALQFRGQFKNQVFNNAFSASKVRFEWRDAEAQLEIGASHVEVQQPETGVLMSSVKIMPNPMTERATLVFDAMSDGQVEIEVFTGEMKRVNYTKVDATKGVNTHEIAGSDLGASGVYYFRILDGAKVTTGKFVKAD